MSNTITANTAGNQTAQQGAGTENPSAEGSRTFTQDEVNSILAKERRETEAKFAGYADFKAKAEEFDKQQEASKSELEKANEFDYQSECHCAKTRYLGVASYQSLITSQNVTAPKHQDDPPYVAVV